VRRYLAAFGPATRKDLNAWSMLPMPPLQAALERLAPLRRFRDEEGRELYDVARASLPPADAPAPIRFLPKWDNVLLAWADRRRILPEEYRRVVIGQNGDVAQTFLVDGFVAGTWQRDGVSGSRRSNRCRGPSETRSRTKHAGSRRGSADGERMRVVPQAVYSCHSHQFAALNKDWLEVAPRSHGHARRANTRRLARSKNPHRYAETRMNRPPPHVHGKEGVDGSSPSEGSKRPANHNFLLSVLNRG
jgi:hypothetical protein